MRASLILLISWWSLTAFGFSMVGPSGLDMQSAALMRLCHATAEDSALKAETRDNIAQCNSVLPTPQATKLTGLALDKKGFVFEVDVDSGCSRVIKYEVEIGPSNDGSRCTLLSVPKAVGIMDTHLKD